MTFTPQQSRIVNLLLVGKQQKEIATEMGVSVNTIKMHMKRMYDKTGIRSRIELALAVVRQRQAR